MGTDDNSFEIIISILIIIIMIIHSKWNCHWFERIQLILGSFFLFLSLSVSLTITQGEREGLSLIHSLSLNSSLRCVRFAKHFVWTLRQLRMQGFEQCLLFNAGVNWFSPEPIYELNYRMKIAVTIINIYSICLISGNNAVNFSHVPFACINII